MTAFILAKKRAVSRALFGMAYADCGCGFEYETDGRRRLRLPAFHLNKIYPYSNYPAIGRLVSDNELGFAKPRIVRRRTKQPTHRWHMPAGNDHLFTVSAEAITESNG